MYFLFWIKGKKWGEMGHNLVGEWVVDFQFDTMNTSSYLLVM